MRIRPARRFVETGSAREAHTDRQRSRRKWYAGEYGCCCVYGRAQGFRRFARSGSIASREGDDEFVSTEPAPECAVRKPRVDDLTDGANGVGAGAMTVGVVDRFQAI